MKTKQLNKQASGMGIRVINSEGTTLARIRLFPGKSGARKDFFAFYNAMKNFITQFDEVVLKDKEAITYKFETVNKIE